jgi:hypothetical protein
MGKIKFCYGSCIRNEQAWNLTILGNELYGVHNSLPSGPGAIDMVPGVMLHCGAEVETIYPMWRPCITFVGAFHGILPSILAKTGVRLKSNGPLSCAYADNFELTLDKQMRLSISVVCGIILSHRWSGNCLSVEHIPATK